MRGGVVDVIILLLIVYACCSSFNRLPLKCLRKSVLRRLRGVGIKNPSIDFRMFSKAMDSPRIFLWNSGKKTGGDSDSRRFFCGNSAAAVLRYNCAS